MSLTEEIEEQTIDRLLQEMGIWLPEIELTDDDSLAAGTETFPMFADFSERLLPPFSS